MSRKKSGSGGFLALLAIIAVLGIGGYYIWMQWQDGAASDKGKPIQQDSLASIRPFQKKLSKQIYALADSAANRNDLSIFIQHYPSNCSWAHNADAPFPVASLYKVPMACKVLSEVDSGRLRLDSMITVSYEDLRPSSYLGALIKKDGSLPLSVKELLELMLQQSDNCAADKLLQLVGGTKEVEKFVQKHGFKELTIRRTLFELFADLYQIRIPEDSKEWTFTNWERLTGTVSEAERNDGRKAIHSDLTDQGTARSLVRLLEHIGTGKLLSPDNSRLLLDILANCQRGQDRLPGLLPAEIKTAHKTGTLRGMVHDMGLIFMPDNNGYLLIAVMIRNSSRSLSEDEALIAKITKVAYAVFKE